MLAPIENLVRNLGRLPGLGRRSAGRAALALVREPDRLLEPLVLALRDAQANVCALRRVHGARRGSLRALHGRDAR